MRKFWIINLTVIMLQLVGCSGTLSPVEPVHPPVVIPETFDKLIDNMRTPAHVAVFLEAFAVYGDPYTGWDRPYGRDLCYELARALYDNYINGKMYGKCATFASFYVLSARTHGYKCGYIIWYNQYYGHALGWIQEKNGKISITDNMEYYYEEFNSISEMLEYYNKYYRSATTYHFYCNQYYVYVDSPVER